MKNPESMRLINTLQDKLRNKTLTEEDLESINKLDQIFIDARKSAEMKVGSNNVANHPWSGELAQAYLEVNLWHAIKLQIERGMNKMDKIESIQSKLRKPIHTIPDTKEQMDTVREKYRLAQEKLNNLRNDKNSRVNHLWDQAFAAEVAGKRVAEFPW